jgi:hypothetical protein
MTGNKSQVINDGRDKEVRTYCMDWALPGQTLGERAGADQYAVFQMPIYIVSKLGKGVTLYEYLLT